ncbi:Sterile alpha and TIR motif-containing protein tir-1,Sterile alpha and TIR motif-containing protein 1 [Mytilus edulis]|uniref:ADP-ribosyl cyclase/cyclic ADP-ribose hydrolase n=1 Tax=Mytilus edulis TaxID=6550 RepID=A0A8S3PP78_MYTED|nr:Sterile alpha and TIR motif-containing protein tir-1,Sterile alpha and TIR motif-containing protein 1 [Mytilus edulis]
MDRKGKLRSLDNDDDDDDFDSMFSRTGPLLERKGIRSMNKFDPDKMIDKSVSESSLFKEARAQKSNKSVSYKAAAHSSSDNIDDNTGILGNKKVSESAKVYFDLSKSEETEQAAMSMKMSSKDERGMGKMVQAEASKSSVQMGQKSSVEAYKQVDSKSKGIMSSQASEESSSYSKSKEVKFRSSECSSVQSSMSCLSQDSFSQDGIIDDLMEKEEAVPALCLKYPLELPPSYSSDSHISWQCLTNLKVSYQKSSRNLEQHIEAIKNANGNVNEEIKHLNSILRVIEHAWKMEIYGRDLSYGLCDVIRQEGILDMVIQNCSSSNKDLLKASAGLLEQILSTENRKYVVENGLETVINMTLSLKDNHEFAKYTTGILEGLFKVSAEAASKMVALGGLDIILHWCRSADLGVLRRCAKAISNLSLFGGSEVQEEMATHNVPEWLFPLAFMADDNIRYYACLAICVLVANKELEAAVMKSGTLDLVMPFINSTKPSVFAKNDLAHRQGRDSIYLEHLIPLLSSRREEAQALAAFHFAMEAGIKAEQGRVGIFYDIGAIEPLKTVASSPNATASKLAAQALKIIGEDVPHKLTPQVPVWNIEDVAHWIKQVGFKDYVDAFVSCRVDGDILLLLTEDELQNSIGMTCKIARKRFLRELKGLKVTADYSSCDRSQIDSWMMKILPDLSQYTYCMLKNGMSKELLSTTSHEELKECGVTNPIHRRLILEHIDDLYCSLPKYGSFSSLQRQKSVDVSSISTLPKAVDVFISYRRSTGSQLASLLKVHLQLRGFTVFLDIDRLRAGKFDENLLINIKMARHFLLVLTPNSLDRCFGDHELTDWVHKEVVTALESDCNIIPVLDSFDWPLPEALPEDMQQVVYFNGVRWVHDYQDACMQKLENFLKVGKRTTQIEYVYGKTPCLLDKFDTDIVASLDNISETSTKKSFKERSTGLFNSIWENIVETY